MSDIETLFAGLGLSAQKAAETASNKKLSANLQKVLDEAGVTSAVDKSIGMLYYDLASIVTPAALDHLAFIAHAIRDGKLKSKDQLTAAIKFAADVPKGASIAEKDFNEACGVGVEVTPEQIKAEITKILDSRARDLEEKRYGVVSQLLGVARQELRWANGVLVKEELDKQVLARIGPKDERDDPKAKKKREQEAKAAAKPEEKKAKAASAAESTSAKISEAGNSFGFVFEGELAKLHKPGGNKQTKEELMVEHLKRTSGKVVTRFPPEPNGFLHIGHAKAINVNFGYAKAHGGITYLRYDDTNPEAEEKKYFDSILEMVRWLGFEPYAVTYSSDHFQRLFDLAVDLIKRDKAYVCHCTPEQIYEDRGGKEKGPRKECAHRNRPVSESLEEFRKMKEGQYGEGEAILRMKMNMQDGNPQFWDLVAYRVMYTPHYRTGDEWCIYPTYDYTHCLCDSFEDITHSLCTTEFQQSRASYYWLVDALEIYKPVQWEYGRLNVTHSIMSKRRLAMLVKDGHVKGWDDPRMFTLVGVRRRGFTPEAINAFVRDLGVTKADSVIPVERLENYVRDHLNEVAPRLMVVLDPLKVTLTNMGENEVQELTVSNKPRDEAMGSHTVPFTRTVYIDASDFKEVDDDPNFYRLAVGKTVGLLNVPHPIRATGVVKDASGKVVEVVASVDKDAKKPKTYIHWVAESKKHNSPVKVEVRKYSNLFYHEDPYDEKVVPRGWITDVNPNSLEVVTAFAEVGVKPAKVEDKFQFVRVGYFCVDPDSDVAAGKYVFNSTVGLKEDTSKKQADQK
ncbi:tRNA synthetases class I, catalytic domain-containing protein [Cladochytrium replicatum]|nr:tRNA synthetases class I, catalytic domain-containing protein [Cladochytrium replicatum]